MNFEYYYNDVPGIGLTRNNLVYTSLADKDLTTFVQWFYNDGEYHRGQNEVVNSDLMIEKFNREVRYLNLMQQHHPDFIPIFDVDLTTRKIYLEIDGKDFWNRAGCLTENYDKVLPDWQDQMLEIIKAHKSLGLHKYSMHPSSYFIVNGKLKSMNYFFTYHYTDKRLFSRRRKSHL